MEHNIPPQLLLTSFTVKDLQIIFRSQLEEFFSTNNIQPVATGPVWYTLRDLKEYLPDKPAEATIYDWVHNRVIPFHKKGKRLFFLKSDIDAWLASGRQKTSVEIDAAAKAHIKKSAVTQKR